MINKGLDIHTEIDWGNSLPVGKSDVTNEIGRLSPQRQREENPKEKKGKEEKESI